VFEPAAHSYLTIKYSEISRATPFSLAGWLSKVGLACGIGFVFSPAAISVAPRASADQRGAGFSRRGTLVPPLQPSCQPKPNPDYGIEATRSPTPAAASIPRYLKSGLASLFQIRREGKIPAFTRLFPSSRAPRNSDSALRAPQLGFVFAKAVISPQDWLRFFKPRNRRPHSQLGSFLRHRSPFGFEAQIFFYPTAPKGTLNKSEGAILRP